MKEKTCILQGFYELVYYNLVSQEYRSTFELKKKTRFFKFQKKKLSKIAERNSQQKKKRKIR